MQSELVRRFSKDFSKPEDTHKLQANGANFDGRRRKWGLERVVHKERAQYHAAESVRNQKASFRQRVEQGRLEVELGEQGADMQERVANFDEEKSEYELGGAAVAEQASSEAGDRDDVVDVVRCLALTNGETAGGIVHEVPQGYGDGRLFRRR